MKSLLILLKKKLGFCPFLLLKKKQKNTQTLLSSLLFVHLEKDQVTNLSFLFLLKGTSEFSVEYTALN